MQTNSRAIQEARTQIRNGVPPGLAIHKAWQEYGGDMAAIARGVRGRRSKQQKRTVPDVSEEWWQK